MGVGGVRLGMQDDYNGWLLKEGGGGGEKGKAQETTRCGSVRDAVENGRRLCFLCRS